MNETMMPYEETIDLKDLCIYILRKWKALVIAVIVGAVVFGGYKVVSGPELVTDSERVKEIETLTKENQEEIQELQKELKEVVKLQESVAGLEYAIHTKENEIKAQTTALENLRRVVSACENGLKEAQELLKTELDSELKAELVSGISALQMDILNNNNQILMVEQTIENLEKDVTSLRAYLGKAEKLEISIEKLEVENKKMAEEDTTVMAPVSVADMVKFAILGAVAGGFVVCGIAFVQYFMDKKLRRAEELKERYGMRILGDFYVPVSKKNKVDQLLDHMEGFHGPVDAQKEAALAAAKIQVLAPADGDKQQIIVTGSVADNMLETVAGQISKNLPVEYDISVVQNPVYDAEALLAVRQGIVVLVEARGVSVKKEIAAMVDILSAAKAKVLGVVLQ